MKLGLTSQHSRVRLVAIIAGSILCALSIRWPQVSTVATVLLLYITLEYVLITQDNLKLARENLEVLKSEVHRQQRVELYFDLALGDKHVRLRVSNLGISNFLLRFVHLRKPDGCRRDHEIHRIIESGKTEETPLPQDLFENEGMDVDLEVTLEYLGLDGGGTTSAKCFNVSLDFDSLPMEVTETLGDSWYARCPKCKFPCITNVYGLRTFEAAEARRRLLTDQLAASCPNHNSEWLLTVEAVRAHHEERKNRHAAS